jgi:hypothetical protein
VKKRKRNNLFDNKARKNAKMCTRGMLLLSIITATGLLDFVKFPEKLFPQVPVSRRLPKSGQIQDFTPSPSFEYIPASTPSPSFEPMPAVELIPASEEVTASTAVPASNQIPAFELITVFAPASFFTPIPVVELLSASEEVPVEVLDTTNEGEPAPSWWRLPEDEQNFWMTFVPYIIFSFLILLVMLHCLRQCWHGEHVRERDRTQLPRYLQEGENIIRQLQDIVAFVQEVQDEHNAQLDDEFESMNEEMEARERYYTLLQNMVESVKTRINARDDHLARLKIQMGLMESLMKAEGERCAQIQEEVHSLKMVVERWVSVPMEQMVDDPVFMRHSCQDEDA